MLKIADFKDRATLPHLLNSMGLVGEAVEIGTHRGDFAAQFINVWKGRLLNCVDPWATPPGYEQQAEMLITIMDSDGDREHDYGVAVQAVHQHRSRINFIRRTSEDAAPLFADNSLDFVYLDGDHQYEPVKKDLRLWWPKIKSGGILAGHDIICPGEINGGWGMYIKPAVEEHIALHSIDAYIVEESESLPASYYMVKV